jgi:hypothetical protein
MMQEIGKGLIIIYNYKLVEIRFEGVIGQNGFNIKDSPLLLKASIGSIINAS